LPKIPQEAEQLATQILGMEIKGLPVRKVLVDEASAIDQEIYFAITDDRAAKKPVMIASAAGGMDIEEVAATKPEKIIKVISIRCSACAIIRPAMSPPRLTCRANTGRTFSRSPRDCGKSISALTHPGGDQSACHHKRQADRRARRQDDDRR
jgi:hypothetical protein